jgi:hypothetical protein
MAAYGHQQPYSVGARVLENRRRTRPPPWGAGPWSQSTLPIIPWSSTVLVRAPAHAGLPDRSGAPAGAAKLPRRSHPVDQPGRPAAPRVNRGLLYRMLGSGAFPAANWYTTVRWSPGMQTGEGPAQHAASPPLCHGLLYALLTNCTRAARRRCDTQPCRGLARHQDCVNTAHRTGPALSHGVCAAVCSPGCRRARQRCPSRGSVTSR